MQHVTKHETNAWILALSAAALWLGGCCTPHAPVRHAGWSWVALSSDDVVLEGLGDGASEFGCDVQPTYPNAGIDVQCSEISVSMTQVGPWLGYRCNALSPASCDSLVQHFAPSMASNRAPQTAGRGSGS